jgi:hypothetical protein
LLSVNICSTIADSGGDSTRAISCAPAGALFGVAHARDVDIALREQICQLLHGVERRISGRCPAAVSAVDDERAQRARRTFGDLARRPVRNGPFPVVATVVGHERAADVCDAGRDDGIGQVGESRRSRAGVGVSRERGVSPADDDHVSGELPVLDGSFGDRARRESIVGAEDREHGGRDEELLGRRPRQRPRGVDASQHRRPVVHRDAGIDGHGHGAEQRAEPADGNRVDEDARHAPRRQEGCTSGWCRRARLPRAGGCRIGPHAERHAHDTAEREQRGEDACSRAGTAPVPAQSARPRVRRKRAYRHRCPNAVTARFADE